MKIRPIAFIHTDFKEKFGIPRQSGRAKSLTGTIVFEPEFRNDEALRQIDSFSHLWLIFDFSLAHREGFSPTVRPPRLGGNQRVGVFASRSPFRPNPLGLSCVKLEKVEKTEKLGTVLKVSGVDLLDNTPIFDIKPYLPFADAHSDALCGYAGEFEDYRLQVLLPDNAKDFFIEEKLTALCECLADDPRPSYQDDAERIYTLSFADVEVSFRVEKGVLTVTNLSHSD